jgi:SAM-dependent methyltransferase
LPIELAPKLEEKMNSEAKFWDKVSSKYAASPVKNLAVYEEKIKLTQTYLQPVMNVLEIGCGTGTTALKHAPLVRHIHAIDFSKNMIEICNRKSIVSATPNITFECQDIFEFRHEGEKFDLIMAHSVLHVLEKKDELIGIVIDLLKPGGVFVISTPCLRSRVGIFKKLAVCFHKLGIFPLLNFFGQDELISSLKAVGFNVDYLWKPSKREPLFLIAKKEL